MTPNIDPALVERMVKVIRAHVEGDTGFSANGRSQYAEFVAILAELPDPDLEAAKDIADAIAGDSDAYRSPLVREPLVAVASCALKHGRANP